MPCRLRCLRSRSSCAETHAVRTDLPPVCIPCKEIASNPNDLSYQSSTHAASRLPFLPKGHGPPLPHADRSQAMSSKLVGVSRLPVCVERDPTQEIPTRRCRLKMMWGKRKEN